ncbi:MAG: MaoC family dehydratase N-terminal domain-containing protein [Woeseiaceae bacterium]|nr:MaoC family dehydratase N-terminal domain-containing protein [Woeseiaceae bacterium]
MTAKLESWIGRTEQVHDDLSSWQARAVAAMLDTPSLAPAPGDPLPPLWHWFYFLGTVPQSRLSTDGHPQRGDFLPPVPQPRRMFAGARMRFHRPLLLGSPATRKGTIRDIREKTGRTGNLTFVTVGYEFHQGGELCVEEEQDIVYREPGAPVPAPEIVELDPEADGTWWRDVEADSRLLFRFSALTFNAHRIHYDRPYALHEEGYPGLVVHGPLTALMLARLVNDKSDRRIAAFSFRGKAPLFDLGPFRLVGRPNGNDVDLEVRGPDGKTTQTATAELEPVA